MKEYIKKCTFYYLDCNSKKHQATRNITLLNSYTNNDLKKLVYETMEQLAIELNISTNNFMYCKVFLDEFDGCFYTTCLKFYFEKYNNNKFINDYLKNKCDVIKKITCAGSTKIVFYFKIQNNKDKKHIKSIYDNIPSNKWYFTIITINDIDYFKITYYEK